MKMLKLKGSFLMLAFWLKYSSRLEYCKLLLLTDSLGLQLTGWSYENTDSGNPLVVQWLRLGPPVPGVWVQPLVRELRSHMPHGQTASPPQKKTITQKKYCNKFSKDFKNGPHQEKNSKKKKRKKILIQQARMGLKRLQSPQPTGST